MSYVRVESSVPRHRKFLQAGPAACWLWLCGLTYCQDGLTDGFIPEEAIDTLGVTRGATALASTLVRCGLWEGVEGGWRIHDYLKHNRSAATVTAIQEERRKAGKRGGFARHKDKQIATSVPSKLPEHGSSKPVAVVVAASEAVVVPSEGGPGETAPMDMWARELVNLYPAQGRCGWNVVERPLYVALMRDGCNPVGEWDRLKARLEQHKRSHQWRVKQMIPRLDKWLRDGLYLQELPEDAPVESSANAKLPEWAKRARAAKAAGV